MIKWRKDWRSSKEEVDKVLSRKKIHVYIGGPISFVEEMQDYRNSIKEGLEKISPKFCVHDPWAREQELDHELYFTDLKDSKEKKNRAEEVIQRDLEDILNCDLLIAYVFKIGPGTSMEIFWMYRILKKPVIIVYTNKENGNEIPLWLYGNCNLLFSSKRALFKHLSETMRRLENG